MEHQITQITMAENKLTSLSDIPYSEEKIDFGTERYVDGLIKFIKQSDTPITIALQGEWGSGKTSLMTRLEHELCGKSDSPYIGIEINTWEYSMMSSPEKTVFKIIAHLVSKLTQNNNETQKKVSNLLRGLYRGGREAMKMIPGVNVLVETLNVPTDLTTQGQQNEQPQVEESASLTDLKSELEKAVKMTISKEDKRGVIVFVDDLDRLNPPVAVEILELLKNIFCINNCIFVLAIDYEVVVKGLEPKFGKLTNENEREFRSFFDKIIQVPFSLPVSSYRPMDFVLSSLVDIGYITGVEKLNEQLQEQFQEIVEYSVGKNPRSIKRLINTLSLLSCIAQSGHDDKDDFSNTPNGRIANFAIVAIQVCYPKIYKMLALMPNFLNWDSAIAARMNLRLQTKDGENPDWEEILEAACATDSYLTQRHNDIRNLLELIKTTANTDESGDDTSFEKNIRSIIDKSSVTGINEPISGSEVNTKRLIDSIHRRVATRIQTKRPDISKIDKKRNTGCGGFRVAYPDNSVFDVTFQPKIANDKIAFQINLATEVRRPQSLAGKSFSEIMEDSRLKDAMTAIDRTIAPLLANEPYFEGRTYEQGTYFKSFTEEVAYRMDKGWMKNHIAQNVTYWINLPSEELFSDKAIIDAIADTIIAAYDFRRAATL